MIIEYIEKLRTRPASERKRFAFALSLSATAIVALLWSTTLPARIGSLRISHEDFPAIDMPAAPSAAGESLQGLIDMRGTLQGDSLQGTGYESPNSAEIYGGGEGQILIATSSANESQ